MDESSDGILTTDLKPKLAMEECYRKKLVKVYGIAKDLEWFILIWQQHWDLFLLMQQFRNQS